MKHGLLLSVVALIAAGLWLIVQLAQESQPESPPKNLLDRPFDSENAEEQTVSPKTDSANQWSAGSFDWPAPRRIKVSESTTRDGNVTDVRYKIDFRAGESDTYVLRLMDLEIVTFNGEPLLDATKRDLKSVIDGFNEMPSFVVNSSGRMIDVQGLEGFVDASRRLNEGHSNDGAGKNVAEALRDDKFRAFFTRALSAYWTCWVEGWIDFPAAPGDAVTVDFEEAMVPGATPVKGRRTYLNFGTDSEFPKIYHLKNETVIQDPRFTDAIEEMIRNLDETNQNRTDPELNTIPEMLAQTVIETRIDVTTLHPVWAKRTKIMRVDSDDPRFETLNRFESHEYTFEWD